MKKYFYLQLKRILKVFPFILTVSVVLFLGLMIVMSSIITGFTRDGENQKIRIGITGDVDSTLVNYAIAAVESIDESSFAIEFDAMSETDAKKQLSKGKIAAYVIIPQEFVDNALYGNITPITYVTTDEAPGVASMFKNEVTKLITTLLVYSQKGSYALSDALDDNGHTDISTKELNNLAINYVQLIVNRHNIYNLIELGNENALTMPGYFASGLTVLFLLLLSLPFVIIYSGKDQALNSLLISRGYKQFELLLSDYLAHLISMLTLGIVIITSVVISSKFMPAPINGAFTFDFTLKLLLALIPALIMISAYNIMFFEMCDNLVSGILLHFFASLCLCYISGCLYPIYTFPDTIVTISEFLPTGITREVISTAFAKANVIPEIIGMLLYSALFIIVAFAVRNHKTTNNRRAKR